MRTMMEQLLELQKLEFGSRSHAPEQQPKIAQLREKVLAPILAHYDRLALRGKKGVATVRNGVCSECHLQIPVGKLASLASTDGLHLCDNCGRYLYLPAGEPIGLTMPKPRSITPAKRSSRKTILPAS